MSRSETEMRPLALQIARNFALWLLFVPIIFILLSPIGTAPLPDAEGWMRLAMVGVPFLLAGAVVEAVSARASTPWRRAIGNGFSTALFMFVVLNSERLAVGFDGARFAKGLVVLPVMALFFALHPWIIETYLTPRKPPTEPAT